MAMLSRVAERVYWSARYLERIENTARLVGVYANLMFDLPRGIDFSWYNMITLNSAEDVFGDRYTVRDERNVVKFMLADSGYSGSLTNSLRMARENIRTTRDVIPEESWELINELNLFVTENIQQGINRGGRHEFLDRVIESCQRISGLWAGTMLHGDAWDVMRCGRNLERADMATRLLDAGASVMLHADKNEDVNLHQVVWANVLTSASGYHSYLRTVQDMVTGPDVALFLMQEREFPRSVRFCISQMMTACVRLPNSTEVEKQLRVIHKSLQTRDTYDDVGKPFRKHINDFQLQLGAVHDAIAESWFPRPPGHDSEKT